MNFDDAITAHSQWKMRLQAVINGTSKETLDPAVVCLDNKCVLGQWIYGEAKQYSGTNEYVELVKEHAHLHRCAAETLRLAQSGKTDEAKTTLEMGGVFIDASIRTINAIRHLRKKVETA
jgi:hypothetical protein